MLYAFSGFDATELPAALFSASVAAVVWWGLPEPRAVTDPCPPGLEDCADRPVPTVLSGPSPEAGHMTEAAHEPAAA